MSNEENEEQEERLPPTRERKGKKSREDFMIEALEKRIARLNEVRGMSELITKARIYRMTESGLRLSLPPLHTFLEDEDLGKFYGPGDYFVSYEVEDENGQFHNTAVKYNIGQEFANTHRRYCQETGNECFLRPDTKIPGDYAQSRPSFLESLSSEKIALISGLLAAFKSLMSGSSGDLKTIIEAQSKMIASAMSTKSQAPEKSGVLDLLSTRLLERAINPEPAPDPIKSLVGSMGAIKEIKELFGDNEGKGEAGMMQMLVEKGMELLPMILSQHGNDARKAGVALRDNKMVQAFISNPEAQAAFYASAKTRIGEDAANRLASGLGIAPPVSPRQPTPQIQEPRQGVLSF